jgi:hypothetical protein
MPLEGINKKIFESVEYLSWLYPLDNDKTRKLLSSKDFDVRQKLAEDLIEKILIYRGKPQILQTVSDLAKIERNIKELQPWVRDHVVHEFLTFLLGVYIDECLTKIKSERAYFKLQWELAGNLHDIGYPLEIANNLSNHYRDSINRIRLKINNNASILKSKPSYIEGLEYLTKDVDAFDLISKQFRRWKINIEPKEFYLSQTKKDNIDHGAISALVVLNVIDLLYDEYNEERKREEIKVEGVDWNWLYYEKAIIPACSAIFLHNIKPEIFKESEFIIKYSKTPIAYLTVLCDTLQEWERPKKDFDGYPAGLFDIRIDENSIIFKADIKHEKKEEIRNELDTKLDGFSIIIE